MDAPLSTILRRPPFYCLATWVAVHILKLNFVVASINDQLSYSLQDDNIESILITIFGSMLPFGFVVLPVVATMLARSTITCFQIANVIGVAYGSVLVFVPDQPWLLVIIVFSSVAMSRQVVYSAVFHQTGVLFGFSNYGVLLGLTNVIVSAVSLVQGPLVKWSEQRSSYRGANLILLALTLPLFGLVYGTVVREPDTTRRKAPTEGTPLLPKSAQTKTRSLSDAGVLA